MKDTILIYGGIVLAVLFIAWMVIKRVFKASPEKEKFKEVKQKLKTEKKLAKFNLENADYSNPTKFLSGRTISEQAKMRAQRYAETLRMSMKGMGTNESKIFSVINSLKSQTEYSLTVKQYNIKYGRSLMEDLKSELNRADLATIVRSIDALPVS